jgi:hypothetical protein
MHSLILPERVTIQLVDKNKVPVKLSNILFGIRAFARRKNDFNLQPFPTGNDGLVTITSKELEADVAANYDSGVMDYAHISDCSPSVEIRILTEEEIKSAVDARKIWTKLLAGERDRWKSLEQLLTLYRNANNGRLLADECPPMRVEWREGGAEYSYKFVVAYKYP